MHMPSEIRDLAERGALFVLNHSGGKDSQAMAIEMMDEIPRDQILVVHANLGRVEWDGAIEHILATIDGLPLIVCRNTNRTLLDMVRDRGKFPSPTNRQCTSDLKRGPIEREVRRFLARPENARFGGLVVNCMGLRADESSNRSKLTSFKQNIANSKAGREWYDWLPIHSMTLDEVWKTIAGAGQKPHPVYELGMSRFSCRFCIMATDSDLRTAAIHSPRLYAEYVHLEKTNGYTMMMPRKGEARTLEDITGIKAEPFVADGSIDPAMQMEPSVRYNFAA